VVGRVKKRISLGILATVLAIGLAVAVVYYNVGFRQSAEVTPVAKITVYTDSDMTHEVEQGAMLAWGEVHSGTQTMDLWVKNTGSVPALIQFNYDQQQLQQWQWTETWSYDGVTPINVGDNIKVTITLTLPDDIGAGHYEWNAGISAWQP
jgi:hypothetical protein